MIVVRKRHAKASLPVSVPDENACGTHFLVEWIRESGQFDVEVVDEEYHAMKKSYVPSTKLRPPEIFLQKSAARPGWPSKARSKLFFFPGVDDCRGVSLLRVVDGTEKRGYQPRSLLFSDGRRRGIVDHFGVQKHATRFLRPQATECTDHGDNPEAGGDEVSTLGVLRAKFGHGAPFLGFAECWSKRSPHSHRKDFSFFSGPWPPSADR